VCPVRSCSAALEARYISAQKSLRVKCDTAFESCKVNKPMLEGAAAVELEDKLARGLYCAKVLVRPPSCAPCLLLPAVCLRRHHVRYTHSLTHSRTHSLTHSLTRLFVCLFVWAWGLGHRLTRRASRC
jgi:hypothetical protein